MSTDKQLAEAILHATLELNSLIGEAHIRGLRVDADIIWTHTVAARWGRPMVTTDVLKTLETTTRSIDSNHVG